MKTIVIGVGNTLRGDDSLGCRAIEALETRAGLPQTDYLGVQQLTPELVDTLKDYERAIFIDARYDAEPGKIVCQALVPEETDAASFSHHFSPERLLLLGRELYGKYPQSFLFSVGAASFELSEELSPAVQAALPALLAEVEALWSQSR